jgi:hypothetical protein
LEPREAAMLLTTLPVAVKMAARVLRVNADLTLESE